MARRGNERAEEAAAAAAARRRRGHPRDHLREADGLAAAAPRAPGAHGGIARGRVVRLGPVELPTCSTRIKTPDDYSPPDVL